MNTHETYAPKGLQNSPVQSCQSSLAGNSVEEKRQPLIPEAHDRIDKTINSLHGLLSTLEARLQPALRIEPCDPKKDSCPQPISQTIYGRMNTNSDDIHSACYRIQELLRLLEL